MSGNPMGITYKNTIGAENTSAAILTPINIPVTKHSK